MSPQPTAGKQLEETLKREIMEDVKSQMKGLTHELKSNHSFNQLQLRKNPQYNLGGSGGDQFQVLTTGMSKVGQFVASVGKQGILPDFVGDQLPPSRL